MNITFLGYFFIPLTIFFLFFKRSDYLIKFTIFLSIFQASSVVNITNGFIFGVSPFYFAGTAIFFRSVFEFLMRKKFIWTRNMRFYFYLLLAILAIMAMISSFILPNFFNGIEVYNPRLGIDVQLEKRATLVWSFSNLAQFVYIFLNVFLFIKISHAKNTKGTYIILEFAALLFTLVAFLQIILGFLGIGFPSQVFNSNPGYAQLYNQEISGFVRVSSTFTEPSTAAAYMSSLLALFVDFSLKNRISWIRKFLYSSVFLVVLLTTSTVAIFCVAIIVIYYFLQQIRKFFLSRKIIPVSLALFIFLISAALLLMSSSPLFSKIANFVLLEKASTQSFAVRTASDMFSLELLLKTGGLGVGLGSNRPSSFLTFLLSNLGILGFAVFSFLIFFTIYASRLTTKKTYSFTFALVIYLIAKVIAVPDLSDSGFWMIWALAFSTIEFKKLEHVSPVLTVVA
jgi:hypothetical protein